MKEKDCESRSSARATFEVRLHVGLTEDGAGGPLDEVSPRALLWPAPFEAFDFDDFAALFTLAESLPLVLDFAGEAAAGGADRCQCALVEIPFTSGLTSEFGLLALF